MFRGRARLGLPTATELLDPITPQYIADLVCWSAIGARTTESQTHRQMASGLSMPLGFKNGTDGSIASATNAIKAAAQSQTFLGINLDGSASAIVTRGNPDCHVVLRGGSAGPNYSPAHIAQTEALLAKAGLPKSILVDCSHDNSASNRSASPRSCANCSANWPPATPPSWAP
jgi:3-deoxy-7-phosphoheptulonate synthase